MNQLGIGTYQYVSYSTGNIDVTGKNKLIPTLTIQFANIETGESARLCYTVCLTRKRTRGKNKAGTPLPAGQFSVSIRYSFIMFWKMAGLELPESLTRFHKCMGKLKKVVFQFEVNSKERINKKTMLELNQGTSRTFPGHRNGISKTLEQDISIFTKASKSVPFSESKLRVTKTMDKGNKGNGIKETSLSTITGINKSISNKGTAEYAQSETQRIQNQAQGEWITEYEEA